MNGVSAIAEILKMEKVDFIGCIPSSPLIEACAKVGIRPIIFRQERVGVNLVDGYSRVSNGKRIGVFAMQAQAGAENAFPGIAQAYDDSVPILALPAADSRARSGVTPTFSPAVSYREITKWSAQINLVERIPELMRRAFYLMRTGHPGPVLLEIPSDIASAELEDSLNIYRPVEPNRAAGDPRDVEKVAEALIHASRPVIQAGQGVLYAEATDELKELSEILSAPVMTTLAGKSAFPENHPLSLGAGGHTTTRAVVHFLREADLIFGIGSSMTLTSFGARIPSDKTIVHSTNDERDINKDYTADYAILGDSKLVLQQLIEAVKQRSPKANKGDNSVKEEISSIKGTWLKEWMPLLTSDEIPINPYRVIWDLMNNIDRTKSIVTHDSGSPRDEMTPFYETVTPRGFLGWGKSTQLGHSLGLIMGAKMAEPSKLAINVMGDAAFGMVGLDFETCVRENIPILTILLNNSGMGIYGPEQFPIAQERYGVKDLTGNYAEIVKAMGGYSERIEKPNEIIPGLKRAERIVSDGQPALLEIITKREYAFSDRLR
jgi:acetolactate synthase-1/2/3 large subunit